MQPRATAQTFMSNPAQLTQSMQNIKSEMNNKEGLQEFDDSKYNLQINMLQDRLQKLMQ